MSFRFEGGLHDFSTANNGPGVHQYYIAAPSGQRILWAYVHGAGPSAGVGVYNPINPSSYDLDGNNEITAVTFDLPTSVGERAVLKMFYTI